MQASHCNLSLEILHVHMFLVLNVYPFNRCAKSPMWFYGGNYTPNFVLLWVTLPLGLSFLRLPSTFSSLHLARSSRSKTFASHVITRYNSTSCTKLQNVKLIRTYSKSLTILCRLTSFMSSYMTYGRAMLCCHVVQYLAICKYHTVTSPFPIASFSASQMSFANCLAKMPWTWKMQWYASHIHMAIATSPSLTRNETKCTNAILIRTLLEGQDGNLILYRPNIMTTIPHYTALDPY